MPKSAERKGTRTCLVIRTAFGCTVWLARLGLASPREIIHLAASCPAPALGKENLSDSFSSKPLLITMSRFFTAGDSSSESSSSDEEELYSDEEPTGNENAEASEAEDEDDSDDSSSSGEEGGGGFSRFLRDAASDEGSSSESDSPKVVKSAKSKRYEELEGTIKLIDNAVKINDWSSISTG